jgi:putative tryptophan/tyrosine transport system substrate-binding protein
LKRREFITLLGSAAAAWPLAARAQQHKRMRRIGILMNLAADDPQAQARVAAFLQGLQEAGWAVGRNVEIDIRWGDRDAERNRKNVAELVALKPDAVLGTTFPIVKALQEAAREVPIVFAGIIDPVGAGLVASLARPGGNTTGLAGFEYGMSAKWLELLKEIAPRIRAGGSSSRFVHTRRYRSVGRNPRRSAVVRRRIEPAGRERLRRD